MGARGAVAVPCQGLLAAHWLLHCRCSADPAARALLLPRALAAEGVLVVEAAALLLLLDDHLVVACLAVAAAAAVVLVLHRLACLVLLCLALAAGVVGEEVPAGHQAGMAAAGCQGLLPVASLLLHLRADQPGCCSAAVGPQAVHADGGCHDWVAALAPHHSGMRCLAHLHHCMH